MRKEGSEKGAASEPAVRILTVSAMTGRAAAAGKSGMCPRTGTAAVSDAMNAGPLERTGSLNRSGRKNRTFRGGAKKIPRARAKAEAVLSFVLCGISPAETRHGEFSLTSNAGADTSFASGVIAGKVVREIFQATGKRNVRR